jgi:REP element-mobilizing transposase RayT
MEYQTNSHYKYLIALHLILVAKYRKQLLVTRRPKQPENTFKSNVSFIDSSQRLKITGFSRRCSIKLNSYEPVKLIVA